LPGWLRSKAFVDPLVKAEYEEAYREARRFGFSQKRGRDCYPLSTGEQKKHVSAFYGELAAHKYSMIRTQLEKDGVVISERDIQIASIAMANKLIVVTHNVKEFNRIVKLNIEDWANASSR